MTKPRDFAKWDRFARHQALVEDPHKALRYAEYEAWAEKRKLPFLEIEAAMKVRQSLVRANGRAYARSTRG